MTIKCHTNPAERKKEFSTPPAPQNKGRRLSFFLNNVTRYTKEKIASEIQRAGYIQTFQKRRLSEMRARQRSEVEVQTIDPQPASPLDHMKKFFKNVTTKFRPENRRLGMRGA